MKTIIITEGQLAEQTLAIDPKFIKLDKDLVLVDTKFPEEIVNQYKLNKMPLDKARVEGMVTALKAGKQLPPLKLDSNNHLKDGHHRYAAFKLAGFSKMPFEYEEKFK